MKLELQIIRERYEGKIKSVVESISNHSDPRAKEIIKNYKEIKNLASEKNNVQKH